MPVLISIPAVLCFLTLGAHFLRQGSWVLTLLCVCFCALLFFRDRRIVWIVQGILVVAAIEWLFTAYDVVLKDQQIGKPWVRGAVILLGVMVFNLVAAMLLKLRKA